MIKKTYACGCYGMDAFLIRSEIDVRNGLPDFEIMGGVGSYEREAAERVKLALKNGNYEFPGERITVNLAPADMPKNCAAIDLALAVGIYAHMYSVPDEVLDRYVLIGELSLDGSVTGCRGVLNMVEFCLSATDKDVIVPAENRREAGLLRSSRVHYAAAMSDALQIILYQREPELPPDKDPMPPGENGDRRLDYADVFGNETVKTAMQVAAAGRHHSLLIGSPGCGKTMVAERLPTIMPDMSPREIIETARVYSAAGKTAAGEYAVGRRPMVITSINTTARALTGGGRIPVPGAVSLAHNGILFVDEATLLDRNCLEALREPLERGVVHVSRQDSKITFPARVLCVLAANPCKCGRYLDDPDSCVCTEGQRRSYMSRISGPIMDRIDLHIKMTTQPPDRMRDRRGPDSETMRRRVIDACEIQKGRFGTDSRFNSDMTPSEVNTYCAMDAETQVMYDQAVQKYRFSNRTYFRILRVARTVADLDGSRDICRAHLLSALSYRGMNDDD